MDVQQRLDDIVAAVEGARSMPMSASCVVNRAELLDMLGEVREALPGSLAQAQELLGGREQMVTEARQEAQRIIEAAHDERGSLVSETELARLSQRESDRILAEARESAAEVQAEADDYVDSKLANFEVVLSKTIGAVDRGRDKLLGRSSTDEPLAGEGPDGEVFEDPRANDPEVRRQRAEEYIEAQFRAFEAVLAKTLEAVGRGRQKLTGHRPTDELGAHMAAQDEMAPRSQLRDSDADYLAGLVDDSPTVRPLAPKEEPAPAATGYPTDEHPADGYPPSHQQPTSYPQPVAAHVDGQGNYPGETGGYERPLSLPPPGLPTEASVPSPPDYYPVGEYQGQQQYPMAGYQDQGYPAPDYQEQTYASQAGPYQDNQQYQPGGYQEDLYSAQGQYGDQGTYGGQGGYGDQGYAPAQTGDFYPQHGQPVQHGQQPTALDETSLFDTSMIDVDQLRRYEQGH